MRTINTPPNTNAPTPGTSGNNGNVMGSYLKDNDTTLPPNIGHTATYTYDALNRITSSIATRVAQTSFFDVCERRRRIS